jgi:hypothetical protein
LYVAHARVRDRAAYERHILHAGEMQIGDELAAAAQQAIVLLAAKARADALPFHRHLFLHATKTLVG